MGKVTIKDLSIGFFDENMRSKSYAKEKIKDNTITDDIAHDLVLAEYYRRCRVVDGRLEKAFVKIRVIAEQEDIISSSLSAPWASSS